MPFAAMTHLKSSLSSLLLRHHRHPVASGLGKLGYRMALALASALFFDRRDCSTLFLRRGMTRPDWIPGGSDIDLTIILKAQNPEQLAAANHSLQRRIRLFNRFSPIPAEVGVFSAQEFARYQNEGDVRAMEIAPGWTVRRGAPPSVAPPRVASMVPLAFSEAFTQFGYLLRLATADAPLCRRLSRNLYKHYTDVLFYCDLARRDYYRYPASRWEALEEISSDGRKRMAPGRVLGKVRRGFDPCDRELLKQIFIDSISELDETARSAKLGAVAAAWEPIPARPLSAEVLSLMEFWRMTASRLQTDQIPVTFHHHRSTYLSIPLAVLQQNNENAVEKLLSILKMTPIHGKPKFPVTDDILRVLSHCTCYLAYSFDIRGVRFDPTGDGDLQWIMPVISPWGTTSLKAKRSTVPTDIRRDYRQGDRADWTVREYLPRLERAIAGDL